MTSSAAIHDEQALVDNISEFISHFLDTRFDNLTPEWKVALAEVCLEMFEAGANWADQTSCREGKSIILT